jgi:hypothetical protein
MTNGIREQVSGELLSLGSNCLGSTIRVAVFLLCILIINMYERKEHVILQVILWLMSNKKVDIIIEHIDYDITHVDAREELAGVRF